MNIREKIVALNNMVSELSELEVKYKKAVGKVFSAQKLKIKSEIITKETEIAVLRSEIIRELREKQVLAGSVS